MDNLKNKITPEILKRLIDLEEKYSLTGQDLLSNLEGLQHADYLKYWDYIHLDTLLSLQSPRTHFPDERIFIMYHQITELYFNLILWEIEQIANQDVLTSEVYLDKILRINRYFKNLIHSFDIMVDGMDPDQFRQFRMALLPSSGFQSVQFRMIEICSTDFVNLLEKEYQNRLTAKAEVSELFSYMYWRKGGVDSKTGKETITSQHFQDKYKEQLITLGKEYRSKNLWQKYLTLPPDHHSKDIKDALRTYDSLINIAWRTSHLRGAARYLKIKDQTVEATGGTNWPKYLPPRFQKVIFYPLLWNDEEKKNWGRKLEDTYL